VHVGMEASKTNQTRWKWHHNTFTPSLHLVPFCQLCTPQNSLHALCLFICNAGSVWYVGVEVMLWNFIAAEHGRHGSSFMCKTVEWAKLRTLIIHCIWIGKVDKVWNVHWFLYSSGLCACFMI